MELRNTELWNYIKTDEIDGSICDDPWLFMAGLYLMLGCVQKQRTLCLNCTCCCLLFSAVTHHRFELFPCRVLQFKIQNITFLHGFQLWTCARFKRGIGSLLLCQHMTSREWIPQLAHLAGILEKSPRPGLPASLCIRQLVVQNEFVRLLLFFQSGQIAPQSFPFVIS